MEKKYKFTGKTKELKGITLHQIQALRSFGNIKNNYYVQEGEIGGWIQQESNLSHEGNCWIFHNACAYENSHVYENAILKNASQVWGKAKVRGNAKVYQQAWLFDHVEVYGSARVGGFAQLRDFAQVSGGRVDGHAQVFGYGRVKQKMVVTDYKKMSGDTDI